MNITNEVTDSLDWLVVFFVHEIIEDAIIYEQAYNSIKDEMKMIDNAFKLRVFMIEEKLEVVEKKINNTYTFIELFENEFRNFTSFTKPPKSWYDALEFFITQIPAKKRLLLTWSHGTAFGINVENPDAPSPVTTLKHIKFNDKKNKNSKTKFRIIENNFYKINVTPILADSKNEASFFNKETDLSAHFKEFKIFTYPDETLNKKSIAQYFEKFSLGNNCKDLHVLWIWQLNAVLTKCANILDLEKPVIDILVMTNCFTNLVDNWSILQDTVKFYIAPETSIDVNGYNYTKMLNSLTPKPIESIASEIIDDFVEKNSSGTSQSKEVLDKTALFCTDLSYSKKAIDIFSDMCQIILDLERNEPIVFETVKADLKYIRKFDLNAVSETVADVRIDVVDLSTLMCCIAERLLYTISSSEISMKLFACSMELKRLLKASTVNQFIGKTIIDDDVITLKKFSPRGGSVFFPEETINFNLLTNKAGICAYSDLDTKSPFTNHTKWDELLKLIYPGLFI